ncbi:MAG: hypothetical protein RL291_94 [Pseudomonadota bacterium]
MKKRLMGVAFERLPKGPHRLAIIDGASHMDLSARDAAVGRTLAQLVVDFFEGKASQVSGVTVREKR